MQAQLHTCRRVSHRPPSQPWSTKTINCIVHIRSRPGTTDGKRPAGQTHDFRNGTDLLLVKTSHFSVSRFAFFASRQAASRYLPLVSQLLVDTLGQHCTPNSVNWYNSGQLVQIHPTSSSIAFKIPFTNFQPYKPPCCSLLLCNRPLTPNAIHCDRTVSGFC